MALVVKGTNTGVEYVLEVTYDQNVADAVARRETANGHYEDITVEDTEKTKSTDDDSGESRTPSALRKK